MAKAIILAAGNGSRMNSKTKKQFMELNGTPLIAHTLKKFQESNVEQIVLVTGKEEIEYCKRIVKIYSFDKVKDIVCGGAERYESVFNGLKCLQEYTDGTDVVLIHDGARPLISVQLINRCIEGMNKTDAMIVGVPVKDTIKIVDGNKNVKDTPDRKTLWSVQTPQVFKYGLIKECYDKMQDEIDKLTVKPTDDSMVVEKYSDVPVKVLEGEYTNIKITTPDDIELALKYMEDCN